MRSRWVNGLLAAGALATGACSSDDPKAPPVTTAEVTPAASVAVTTVSAAGSAVAPGTTQVAPRTTVAAASPTTPDPGTTSRTLGAINGPAVVESTAAP